MNRQNILKTAIMLAATLLIAACTNDETADSQPETLPEGQYPLEIASVTMSANAPQSRVVENLNDGMSSAWEWNGSEKIGVRLYEDGETATYTLNEGLSLTSDKTLYWKNTEGATITAWYPTYEGESGTVSLANQSGKLAYVLRGTACGDYKSSVGLTFTHALAKVRVKLSGDKAQEVSKVYLYTYTSCTNTQGIVSNGTSAGWIEMKGVTYNNTKCYEANVVPDYDIAKFKINDTEGTLTTTVTPVAAKLHEIAVDVSGPATVVEISGITEPSYTVKGNINLKGDGNSHDLKLTLEDGAKLTLDGVTLQRQEEGNVVTCKGNATINLNHENSITGKTGEHNTGNAIYIESGTLTINGPGSLTATGEGYYGGGICAEPNASILIQGGTITATSNDPADPWFGAPGIGHISTDDILGSGTIYITGGTITAKGGGTAAGIGSGTMAHSGSILITGSKTVVTAKKGGGRAEDIGGGENGSYRSITFTGGATVNGQRYE